jgi:hypothetical protein
MNYNEIKIEEEEQKPLWNPSKVSIPEIVKNNMDLLLTREEKLLRRKHTILALLSMKRDGLIQRKTITMHLQGVHKGETVEKEFTFYKSIPEPKKK